VNYHHPQKLNLRIKEKGRVKIRLNIKKANLHKKKKEAGK